MDKKPTIRFEVNKEYPLRFLFDSPMKSGENERGEWYMYSVHYDSVEHIMFATGSLEQMLKCHAPLSNKTLTIKKIPKDVKGKTIAIFTVDGKTITEMTSGPTEGFSPRSPDTQSFQGGGDVLETLTAIKKLTDGLIKKLGSEEKAMDEPNKFDRYNPHNDEDDEPVPF